MPHVDDACPQNLPINPPLIPSPRVAAWRVALNRALRGSYVRGLAVVSLLYVVLYASFLGFTRGVPYVTDGNESFSMLIHASNLYHFPIGDTFGLSDEALSRDPAAHPYVYTHQGNFPRFYSFLLYALGARSAESQIVITTFTVGLLSVFLIYHYLTRISTTGFAVLSVAIFLTDYLLFAQWQVNTYRVWHGLLFFLSLICVHGVESAQPRRWLALTVVTFACLFYFELAFALFVGLMAGLYAGVRYFRRPRLLVRCWGAQAAGAAIAIGVLIGQLIGYLGWADFLQDLQLTYTARNLVAQDPAYADRIRDFVENRHIVFWYNFANVEYSRSPAEILSSLTRGYFTVYTPTLWYLVTIVLAGWFAGLGRNAGTAEQFASAETEARPNRYLAVSHAAALLLLVCWTRFLLAVVQDDTFVAIGGPRLVAEGGPLTVFIAAVVSVVCLIAISRAVTGFWFGVSQLSPLRLAVGAGTLLVAEHVVLNSSVLFDPFYLPLWSYIHGIWFPGWAVQVAVAAAGGLSVILSLKTSLTNSTRWPSVAIFLLCGLIAYAIVYALSPGYVHSGYLDRWAPFGSFLAEIAIALTIYVGWSASRPALARFARWRNAPGSRGETGSRMAMTLVGASVIALVLFPVVFWLSLQASHVRLLPATHLGFIKQLGNAPLQGASFAVNTYAAPVYAYTGQWAYFDTKLGLGDGGLVSETADAYTVNHDPSTYLWLADRDRNQEYLRPRYFLCVSYQDLRTAVQRIRGVNTGCSSAGVVRHVDDSEGMSVAGDIVARDRSGRDNWAIVSLDWAVLERLGAGSSSAVQWSNGPTWKSN